MTATDRDTRRKDFDWRVRNPGENTPDMGRQLAVLMDIRDELKKANERLAALETLARCHNVRGGFIAMRRIARVLEERFPKKRKRKKRAKT